jgi:hypothetical protein
MQLVSYNYNLTIMITKHLSILLLFLSSFCYAQFPTSIGFNTGVLISNQKQELTKIDYEINTNILVSNYADLYIQQKLNTEMDYQLSLGYYQKGSKSDFYGVAVNHMNNNQLDVFSGDEYEYKFKYITFCSSLIYNFDFNNFKLSAIGGPRIDYLVNYSSTNEIEIEKQKKIIAGINIGFALAYQISDFKIGLDVKEIFDLTKAVDYNNVTIKNNSIAVGLSLSYIFQHEIENN